MKSSEADFLHHSGWLTLELILHLLLASKIWVAIVPILKGKRLVKILLGGPQFWNAWVLQNTAYDVQFDQYAINRLKKNFGFGNEIRLTKLAFPTGTLIFKNITLEETILTFDNCTFPCCNIFFRKLSLKNAEVRFNNNTFIGSRNDKQTIIFFRLKAAGQVQFLGGTFIDSSLHFIKSILNDGAVFSSITFLRSNLEFDKTEFNGDEAYFYSTKFFGSKLSFSYCRIKSQNYYFADTKFFACEIKFIYTNFDGNVFGIDRASFKQATCEFLSCIFDSHVMLINLENVSRMTALSFRGSRFHNTMELRAVNDQQFGCIVDFTATCMDHHIILENNRYYLRRVYSRFEFCRSAEDAADGPRLTRLRELAMQNRNYRGAIDLHVQELRANRWSDPVNFGAILNEFFFQLLSDYGRSLLRPFYWLITNWLVFGFIYAGISMAKCSCNDVGGKLRDGAIFSLGHLISFIPIAQEARQFGDAQLFRCCKELPTGVYFLALTQTVTASILIFLIALALRNHLRI